MLLSLDPALQVLLLQFLLRALLNPLMIEGEEASGQLMTTTEVENFPGFKSGIMGPELMAEIGLHTAI